PAATSRRLSSVPASALGVVRRSDAPPPPPPPLKLESDAPPLNPPKGAQAMLQRTLPLVAAPPTSTYRTSFGETERSALTCAPLPAAPPLPKNPPQVEDWQSPTPPPPPCPTT